MACVSQLPLYADTGTLCLARNGEPHNPDAMLPPPARVSLERADDDFQLRLPQRPLSMFSARYPTGQPSDTVDTFSGCTPDVGSRWVLLTQGPAGPRHKQQQAPPDKYSCLLRHMDSVDIGGCSPNGSLPACCLYYTGCELTSPPTEVKEEHIPADWPIAAQRKCAIRRQEPRLRSVPCDWEWGCWGMSVRQTQHRGAPKLIITICLPDKILCRGSAAEGDCSSRFNLQVDMAATCSGPIPREGEHVTTM